MHDVAVRDDLLTDAGPDPLARQRLGRFRAFGGEPGAQFGNCAGRADIEAPLGPEDIREFTVRSNLHIVTWAVGSVEARSRFRPRRASRQHRRGWTKAPADGSRPGLLLMARGKGIARAEMSGRRRAGGVSSESLAAFMARARRTSDDPDQFRRIAYISTLRFAPPSGASSAAIDPPWASATCRAKLSPTPLPPL